MFAQLYDVRVDDVESYDLSDISAMKVSFPRPIPSGDFGDTDITGGQQYAVLVEYLAALRDYPVPETPPTDPTGPATTPGSRS